MTRKDYILLAEALRGSFPISENVNPTQAWENTIKAISHALSMDNERFNSETFNKACRGVK